MAQLNFPSDPQQNDTYVGDNGVTYTYDGTKWLGGAQGLNLSALTQDLIPSQDLTYDLGAVDKQWHSLYVGTGTIFIGGIPISVNQTNNTLVVGVQPGEEPTTATNVATESFVIDYISQTGGGIAGVTTEIIEEADPGNNTFAVTLNAGRSDDIDITVYASDATPPEGTERGPAIAIGRSIGGDHADNAIAIGNDDVGYEQGPNSIAIGKAAGWANDSGIGANAIAIGHRAAYDSAPANSITLNATGEDLNPDEAGLFIKPIREDSANKSLYYNTTTGEVVYNNGGAIPTREIVFPIGAPGDTQGEIVLFGGQLYVCLADFNDGGEPVNYNSSTAEEYNTGQSIDQQLIFIIPKTSVPDATTTLNGGINVSRWRISADLEIPGQPWAVNQITTWIPTTGDNIGVPCWAFGVSYGTGGFTVTAGTAVSISYYADAGDNIWSQVVGTNQDKNISLPNGTAIWFNYGYIDQDSDVDYNALRLSGGDGVTIKAAEDNRTWRFDSDGYVTFPDETVQKTAFTGDKLVTEKQAKIIVGNSDYFAIVNRTNPDGQDGVNATAVAYDQDDNIITLHVSNTKVDMNGVDLLVVSKFDTTGATVWQKQFDQDVNGNTVHDLVVLGGYIYIAVSAENDASDDTIIVICLDEDGDIEWQKDYHGVENSSLQVGAMVGDGDYIYVSGYYNPNNTNDENFIMKIDISNSGSLEWAWTYDFNPSNNQVGRLFSISVEPEGDLIAVGYTSVEAGPDAAIVQKVDSDNGEVIWASAMFDPEYNIQWRGGDVAVDSQNNIYIALNAQQTIVHAYGDDTTVTIAYVGMLNEYGAKQWFRRVGPGPCASVATGITVDGLGYAYLSALTVEQPNPGRDFNDYITNGRSVLALAKYGPTGTVEWQRYIEAEGYYFIASASEWGPPGYFDPQLNRGRNISVNASGKIAVQVSVTQRDADDNWSDEMYLESMTFQIDQDGRTMTIGSGNQKFTVKESRIPGKLFNPTYQLFDLEEAPWAASGMTEDVTVTTATLTISDGEMAQQVSKTEPYQYNFENDGTLVIPNDGDLKLTQTQIGWFSIFGPAQNYNDNIDIRCNCVDPETGDVYVAGESDDFGQGFLSRYNSQGQRLWTIRFYDNENQNDNRANAIKIHPTRRNPVVLLEYYGNNDVTAIVEVDADTAKVINSFGLRDSNDNDTTLAYDFGFTALGDQVIVGKKYDEYRQQSVTALAGSGPEYLVFNASDLSGTVDNTSYVSGTGITGRYPVVQVNRFTGLTGTVRQGSSATFNIIADGGGYDVVTVGTSFVVITTTDLGNADTSDSGQALTKNLDNFVTPGGYGGGVYMTLAAGDTVTAILAAYPTGGIIPITWGAGSTTIDGYASIVPNTSGPLAGTVQFTAVNQAGDAVAGTWYFPASISVPGAVGTNYLVGHKILIPGGDLGGVTTVNDVVVTVTSVTESGAINGITYTGTSTGSGTYNGVSGQNYQTGSGFEFGIYKYNSSESDYGNGTWFSTTAGSNYVYGDVITVSGADLLGTSPANDLTVTVLNVDGGGILDITRSGTAVTDKISVWVTADPVDFSTLGGAWTIDNNLGGEAFVWSPGYTKVLSAGGQYDTERYLSVVLDEDDNVYAAGEMMARNNAAGVDLNDVWCAVVSKFDASGNHLWTKALNDTVNDCYAKSVAVKGNAVVVTHENNSGWTVVTKLDGSGNIKWQRKTYSNDDSSVAIDDNGDIYAVIETWQENRYQDCVKVVRFNAGGEVVWRKLLAVLVYEYDGGNNLRFKNGRNLTIDADNLYISGYSYAFANYYRNGFLAKIPKSGDADGFYGVWTVQADMYDLDKVTETEAATFTPVTGQGSWQTWDPDFASNWWDPSGNGYSILQEIRDRDGGAIVFADGSRQTRSGQMLPQTLIDNGRDHRLTLEDMGGHIFVNNSDTVITVPYHIDIPLPIGYTVMIINDTGSSINVDADGGGITMRNGVYDGSYWSLDSYGTATLIKVRENYWYLSGNIGLR